MPLGAMQQGFAGVRQYKEPCSVSCRASTTLSLEGRGKGEGDPLSTTLSLEGRGKGEGDPLSTTLSLEGRGKPACR